MFLLLALGGTVLDMWDSRSQDNTGKGMDMTDISSDYTICYAFQNWFPVASPRLTSISAKKFLIGPSLLLNWNRLLST